MLFLTFIHWSTLFFLKKKFFKSYRYPALTLENNNKKTSKTPNLQNKIKMLQHSYSWNKMECFHI